MSHWWGVHCLDCGDTDNYEERLETIEFFIRHRETLAAVDLLQRENGLIELTVGRDRRVEIRWFAKHAGHRIVPIDEYGSFSDECGEYYDCTGGCGEKKRCHLKREHAGDHGQKRTP